MIDIINEKYLMEMAIINPKLCRTLPIKVAILQGGEGPTPHLHIMSNDGKLDTCVKLLEPEYFEHGKHKGKMTKQQKELFIKVMLEPCSYDSTPDGLAIKLNGYQTAVKLWVESYEDSYKKFGVLEAYEVETLDYSGLATK